ncbi:MAG: hypothetical protein ABW185_23125, partial [Sedimenticola sp.]
FSTFIQHVSLPSVPIGNYPSWIIGEKSSKFRYGCRAGQLLLEIKKIKNRQIIFFFATSFLNSPIENVATASGNPDIHEYDIRSANTTSISIFLSFVDTLIIGDNEHFNNCRQLTACMLDGIHGY